MTIYLVTIFRFIFNCPLANGTVPVHQWLHVLYSCWYIVLFPTFLNVPRCIHCSRDVQKWTIWQKCRCICIWSYSLRGTGNYPIYLQEVMANYLLPLGRCVIPIGSDSKLLRNFHIYIYLPVLLMVQMIEGTPPFHPNPQEEAAKMICLEGLRPQFKNKPKYYPNDVKEWVDHTL